MFGKDGDLTGSPYWGAGMFIGVSINPKSSFVKVVCDVGVLGLDSGPDWGILMAFIQ